MTNHPKRPPLHGGHDDTASPLPVQDNGGNVDPQTSSLHLGTEEDVRDFMANGGVGDGAIVEPSPIDAASNQITGASDQNQGSNFPQQQTTIERLLPDWVDSPFAVGLTQPTWADEKVGLAKLCGSFCQGSQHFYLYLVAFCCTPCGAGRVGNMVILRQEEGEATEIDGLMQIRPRLVCLLGPYFPILLGITIPGLAAFSAWTASRKLTSWSWPVLLTWALCNLVLFWSLLNVSCRDPGILYRHRQPPAGPEGASWLWNDQALTYRPAHAKFDPECAVVIEHFDHTCPWTGTAIGKKNMLYFRIFLVMVPVTIVYNIALNKFV